MPVRAASVAYFNFGGDTGSGTYSAAPTTNDPNLTVSNLIAGPNDILDGITPGKSTFPDVRVTFTATTATLAAAVTSGSYFEIDCTPSPGFQINCSSLTFIAWKGGTGTRGCGVRSSADNFTTNLPITLNGAGTTVTNADLTTVRTDPTFDTLSINLSGASFQGLIGTFKLRFYAYSPGGGSSVEFDDIALNGSVFPTNASVWQPASGNWNTAANWQPAAVPVSSATTYLAFIGATQFSSNDNIGGIFKLNFLRIPAPSAARTRLQRARATPFNLAERRRC